MEIDSYIAGIHASTLELLADGSLHPEHRSFVAGRCFGMIELGAQAGLLESDRRNQLFQTLAQALEGSAGEPQR